ncbi:PTS glucitol/sorbitol transporter subunit IIA [Lactobacillus sp.]|uniref:PTS glucitol/sorbitol transporter subunit IIA n=1 Tax=Lactobacillus sp. TaxID=1591 RepID=UPI0019AEE14D|nr:PTS glucitol/sorbitol transporter subunit IIA [Lactobacillus sp.]MBD5430338.1 PTS glucitol/sorbitol transporter subunit IIA [Lactobacillus sp.]
MKWNSTIEAVGPEAISPNENIIILFNETATDNLKRVSVIQKFDKASAPNNFILKKDDTITIDGKTFLILYVGLMVEMNIKAIGHATLVFTDEVPKKPLKNAIYLEKDEEDPLPMVAVGDWISYEHR